jgi:hypothetical protein
MFFLKQNPLTSEAHLEHLEYNIHNKTRHIASWNLSIAYLFSCAFNHHSFCTYTNEQNV